jgi:Zn-dependent M28 family amino/carboxypeptidase
VDLESANIVAKLTGTDPLLKKEFVVLSAHIDHVGIGEPVNGDKIYNGAMDDGSGTAAVMDLAASLKRHPEKLRRSILFVLVTAEEKGLLGSKYFAAHPTVDAKAIVADINIDMFLPIVPLKVLRVQGINDSTLGDRASSIAHSFAVQAVPDPEPLRNLFVRSDQYNFIRRGIPSVIMDVFYEPNSPEAKIFKNWLTQRYHAPSDDVNQPVDLHSAALYEESSDVCCWTRQMQQTARSGSPTPSSNATQRLNRSRPCGRDLPVMDRVRVNLTSKRKP